MWKGLKRRFKNPLFLAGVAGIVYQALVQNGVHIDNATFKLGADLAAYALLGVGIYSEFGQKEKPVKKKK